MSGSPFLLGLFQQWQKFSKASKWFNEFIAICEEQNRIGFKRGLRAVLSWTFYLIPVHIPHVIKGRPKASFGTSQAHLLACYLQARPGLALLSMVQCLHSLADAPETAKVGRGVWVAHAWRPHPRSSLPRNSASQETLCVETGFFGDGISCRSSMWGKSSPLAAHSLAGKMTPVFASRGTSSPPRDARFCERCFQTADFNYCLLHLICGSSRVCDCMAERIVAF